MATKAKESADTIKQAVGRMLEGLKHQRESAAKPLVQPLPPGQLEKVQPMVHELVTQLDIAITELQRYAEEMTQFGATAG